MEERRRGDEFAREVALLKDLKDRNIVQVHCSACSDILAKYSSYTSEKSVVKKGGWCDWLGGCCAPECSYDKMCI